ncbi:probable RNA-dependent RNA polymerase 3 isoform X2 [Typha angustifolia]|uniref:probable RNA-dependent RNA polymerase 3 isoform X2 n=1 Tax=Typha angustifolia TaxID=59011 RepID=UPI003C2D9070
MATPPPHSPTPTRSPSGRHLHLPAAVEELLHRICRNQSLPPPDHVARRELDRIGEDASLRILRQIAESRVKDLSRFITYMAKSSDVVLARNAEGISTRESACFSGPSSPGFSSVREESVVSPLSQEISPREMASPVIQMSRGEMTSPIRKMAPMEADGENPLKNLATPQMLALGELEFRKAFLILSYLGRKKLEEAIPVDFIKSLESLPMIQFESVVWREVGCKYISESDRRKNLDWDSRKTHVYHCCVDIEGNVTFKGPYLQTTKTHLQRVLGDDNVLVVKFAEMNEESRSAYSFGTYCFVYHKVAEEGIMVGLHCYRFFVFKDGGKAEKKRSITSSSVRCYFVRTESGWAMDNKYTLSDKLIHEARTVFMHVHTVSSLAKYMARFSLILSKTIKLDIDLSSVHIEKIEDIPCMDEYGNIVYNEDCEPRIHTDGTGFISEDLAMKCPGNIVKGSCLMPQEILNVLDGCDSSERFSSLKNHRYLAAEPPLLIQFRLFYNGSAVKGTLLIDKRLPPRTICIRPSMIKVESDPSISYIQYCNSLEIVNTSNRPKRTCLSRYLIALLHYGGVPKEYFLELLRNALDDAESARYSTRAALRVALNYADMDDSLAARMILCGIPLNEPYLKSRLSVMMQEEKKGLMGGKVPVSECYYLMGTTDPTGTLKPNEVCIILENGHVSGNVLVYKHPGLHFGDIHILTATYIKGLEKIVGNAKYAIFFPVNGPRSLADEMANSDFDGDIYWVSRNPQVFGISLLVMGDDTSEPSYCYTISAAADCWLAYMDRLLTPNVCTEEKQFLRRAMLQLVDIYYDAVDAPKSGIKVEVPPELKVKKYPHFMGRSDDDSYNSTSILGVIHDKVKSSRTEHFLSSEICQLPCFSEEAPQSCLQLWMTRYRDYLEEMARLCSMDHESKESKELMVQEVFQKYKELLYGAAEFEESTRPRNDIFNEAVAIYQIAYNNAKNSGAVGKCGFAWKVAGRALCLLHIMKQEELSISCSRSVLKEILR